MDSHSDGSVGHAERFAGLCVAQLRLVSSQIWLERVEVSVTSGVVAEPVDRTIQEREGPTALENDLRCFIRWRIELESALGRLDVQRQRGHSAAPLLGEFTVVLV